MANSKPFFALSADETLQSLDVDASRGLSERDVESRREKHGRNELHHAKRRDALKILLEQFKSVVILILAAAAVSAVLTAQWTEAVAIAAVVAVNTIIGFVAEYKAARSMEALRELGGQNARVRRDGEQRTVAVHELVPGDIVLMEKGDLVPADTRLLKGSQVRVNEAALTGESVPVNKTVDAVPEETPLAERRCQLYKGTSLADGEAEVVVTNTGTETELGRISQLADEAESNTAPLQKRLDKLGRQLAYVTIGVAVVVALSGLAAGRDPLLMVETAIALGVAAIPEGLPIVATIALARGMWLMAQRNALVNRLTAVETLGATRVIFTDKTGTLTENEMRLHTAASCNEDFKVEQAGGEIEDVYHHMLRIGVLCNGAELGGSDEQDSGDPTEVALLRGGEAFQLSRASLLEEFPEQRVVEFDTDTMMMATYHQADEDILVAVKGAPHRVVEVCDRFIGNDGETHPLDDPTRDHWQQRVEQLAGRGLRVLAIADKTVSDTQAEPYQELRLIGLVGLLDPPRHEVRDSINRCQAAGIRVLMVTGDDPVTGQAIGRAVGIGDNEDAPAMHGSDLGSPEDMTEEDKQRVLKTVVFARVSPEQKLDLVDFYQQRGEPVAMTGDGVNDAPALKKADIGIAMGRRGTDAAKQTADMILRDDSFSTIAAAVEQGRIIFGNIRKSIVFMLCTNVAEVLAVTLASLIGAPLPLLPLQILYLNVITDVFPALALGVGRGRPEVMHYPPREPNESVLTKHLWKAIVSWSIVIASFVMTGLLIALWMLGYADNAAITVSFLTLGLSKLWFVFNLRDHDASPWDNDITRNGWLWGALALCVVLLLAAVYLPVLSDVLQTVPPGPRGWILAILLSMAPAVIGLFAPKIHFHPHTKKESESRQSDASESDQLGQRIERLEAHVESNAERIEALKGKDRSKESVGEST